MKHGIDHECKALEQYQNYFKHSGHPVKTFSSGFVVNPAYPFLSCSPDARVIDETEDNAYGIAVIKYPCKHLNVTPETACAGDSQFHLQMKDDFSVLKTNHRNCYQVQGQMGMTGAKWCDFVTYTFQGMIIERIYIDPDFFAIGDRKPTETSVTEFCYKSVNLSLEELKNIKILLFLIQELFR